MLKTIAYFIFLCTGVFAVFLIVLFFRDSQMNKWWATNTWVTPSIVGTSGNNKVLTKLESKYKFHKSSQNDVFGAFIFHFSVESRVAGPIRVYIFENDYSLIRRNLLLLSSMYTFTDTTDFFGKTMFLNDKTGDGQIVRFITEIDGRTFGFEVLRDEYNDLKSLILQ